MLEVDSWGLGTLFDPVHVGSEHTKFWNTLNRFALYLQPKSVLIILKVMEEPYRLEMKGKVELHIGKTEEPEVWTGIN